MEYLDFPIDDCEEVLRGERQHILCNEVRDIDSHSLHVLPFQYRCHLDPRRGSMLLVQRVSDGVLLQSGLYYQRVPSCHRNWNRIPPWVGNPTKGDA
jgi:hypothetical protein